MTPLQILHDGGIYTPHIAEILGMTENEVNDERDAYEKELDRLAAERVEPDVSEDFLDALTDEQKNHYRLTHLRNEYRRVKKEFQDACKEYALQLNNENPLTYWQETHIAKLEHEMHTLIRQGNILHGKAENISPETIGLARQYPISQILKVNKAGMASCPFHEDKKPSMDTRKNFYHCYSCGETGDVINLVIKLEKLTFAQAITRLT